MRLLKTDRLEVIEFVQDRVPKYAILSHTWGEGEVSLQDVQGGRASSKTGFSKVSQCCIRARADGFDYLWVDTCCIDKTSSAELSEAINSMYLWYFKAETCYAHLADVQSESTLAESRWLTRGWTLQELIAPPQVYFLNQDWKDLGTKESLHIAQRMSWAAGRRTTRVEDGAYCLMGLFSINMPLIYGEGERAFIRLQEEIMRVSDDYSLFAWRAPDTRGGLLATSPAAFAGSNNIVPFSPLDTPNSPFTNAVELEAGDANGMTPLMRAVDGGNAAVAKLLLDKGANMEVKNQYSRTVLLQAMRNRHAAIVKLLLDKGADVEVKNECSRAMLLQAMRNRHEAVIELLLDKGADIEARGPFQRTPLFQAVKDGNEALVKKLLDKGANVEAIDYDRRTPLLQAVEEGAKGSVELLLDKGANIEAYDFESKQTPLARAAALGHEAIVRLLLDRGADLEAKDSMLRTPLQHAKAKGNQAVVQLLLDKGADATYDYTTVTRQFLKRIFHH
ncbi:ankyrin repeats (3 copies) domain-containing protein [Hirsutella rhossiliensis]|uniref:Ankyrin repeats (3 copies) domain-containing protein n=1 Tax=Hirsutella rhossiliensis TaxID=111463 RepID=A0A9P8SL42_9HYPO|nr:ankyrin repeats (3 copies) domain-containing protein [Hirsutella rhossiliensis]KAH0965884.1 ankyrin repeats (3 copies) domain-containing protein [Hirsutella rhossiliensis]